MDYTLVKSKFDMKTSLEFFISRTLERVLKKRDGRSEMVINDYGMVTLAHIKRRN
jgi:hypothetical protein